MIVVSNTSPLNYLVLIDAQHVLPALYGRVLIPSEVWNELGNAPPKVQQWLKTAPTWLEVRKAPEHTIPARLHAGEAAAIALAKQLHAALLLIDDDAAYRFATKEGFRVTRIPGVLRHAAAKGLIDLGASFEKLKQTNYRVPPTLLDDILRDFNRRQTQEAKPNRPDRDPKRPKRDNGPEFER